MSDLEPDGLYLDDDDLGGMHLIEVDEADKPDVEPDIEPDRGHHGEQPERDGGSAPAETDLEVLPVIAHNGRLSVVARVPRIERRFESPLHSVENTAVQTGPWPGELDLVLSRRAPTAQLTLCDYFDEPGSEDIRNAVRDALAKGFAGGLVIEEDGIVHGRLALPDPIADAVDLDALRADYEAWFAAADVIDDRPEVLGRGRDETVADLIELAFDDLIDRPTWSQHLWEMDHYDPGSVDGGIKFGLVSGHDPAGTCAFILRTITGDVDRWWRSVR